MNTGDFRRHGDAGDGRKAHTDIWFGSLFQLNRFKFVFFILYRKKELHMAKGMTKTQLVRAMAEKNELTNKQAAAFLEGLADTAVKETKKNGEFTIPGIGKLVKAERKARTGRNPQTGEAIKIKAKTVVKFRVAKVAKDTIAPPKK
jgi:DNA-binding protein HU-beta